MSLSRWDPFLEMTALRSAMDQLVDRSVVPSGRDSGAGMSGGVPLDVIETDDAYVVKASLPGVKPDDMDISIHRNVLSISGEMRGEEERAEQGRIHHRERWYGSFRRQISLPGEVDTNACDASFEDGVLTIRLPKSAGSRPRRIGVGGRAAIDGESREGEGRAARQTGEGLERGGTQQVNAAEAGSEMRRGDDGGAGSGARQPGGGR